MKEISIINNIFATEEALNNLAKKENARVLVVSDSHGKYDALENIVLRYGKECDALVHCGDGNIDLTGLIRKSVKDEKIDEALPPVIAFVRGNCDEPYYNLGNLSPKKTIFKRPELINPQSQLLTVNGIQLMIAHGHSYGVSFERMGLEAKILGCKAVLYGHTHVSSDNTVNGIRFINPGSCSFPRDNHNASFAILTIGKNFIDTAFLQRTEAWNPLSEFKIYTPLA
ncbi:MAG: metallophosphoesterase [Treponema sp.]|nr:metallophosphoesterase [Treponema sp.]